MIFVLHNSAIDDMDDEMDITDDYDDEDFEEDGSVMVIDASNMTEDELEEVLSNIIGEFSEYEGMYGWQLLEYLMQLVAEEAIPEGEAFHILSLSIEWPAEIMIEPTLRPGSEDKII